MKGTAMSKTATKKTARKATAKKARKATVKKTAKKKTAKATHRDGTIRAELEKIYKAKGYAEGKKEAVKKGFNKHTCAEADVPDTHGPVALPTCWPTSPPIATAVRGFSF
jgi:hypothetical protein